MKDKSTIIKDLDLAIQELKPLVLKGTKVSDKDIRDGVVKLLAEGAITAAQGAQMITAIPDDPIQRAKTLKQELGALYANRIHLETK